LESLALDQQKLYKGVLGTHKQSNMTHCISITAVTATVTLQSLGLSDVRFIDPMI